MILNMDDEILVLFIEEAREHLSGIEGDLLDIEAMADAQDKELVNKVFRAIHSIKGGAGFWGLENVKNLSHEMENILNQIRNGERFPDPIIISALLDGADLLSVMVNNLQESDNLDITLVLAALNPKSAASPGENISVEKPVEQNRPAAPAANQYLEIANISGDIIFSISREKLDQARRGGKYLYYAECDLLKDIKGKEKPLEDLLDELLTMGDIVESYTNMEAVGSLDVVHPEAPLPFHLVFSSIVDPDLIDSVQAIG